MNGYLVLCPQEGTVPTGPEIATALESAGWPRWDGCGLPGLAVFHTAGPKGDYFEAGFWGGKGVPVFFLGGGARAYQRKQIVNRFAGWTVVGGNGRAGLDDLLAAIRRRFPATPERTPVEVESCA